MIIPFDRNRVILTPIPGREHSTYINASFIEGYDNSESFIITQDPLENTIADFWRMISEQGIKTIVMVSEVSLNLPIQGGYEIGLSTKNLWENSNKARKFSRHSIIYISNNNCLARIIITSYYSY